jgi:dsRNA-specific ribonuclease
MYEFLGDAIVNSSIVKYVYTAYPNSRMEHVQVLARLKILMASKSFIFKISDQLGFKKYIKAEPEVYETDIRSTMEDVFEAFFGCTYCMFNELYTPMSGDSVCYVILCNILDTLKLPTTYEDLVDPITRLKELMDTYTHLRQDVKIKWTYDSIKRVHTGVGTFEDFKASSTKYKKADAHQHLSEQLLSYLAFVGYTKPVNPAFEILKQRRSINF